MNKRHIIFCWLFVLTLSSIQAQEKVQVIIGDTLLQASKEDFVPGGRLNHEEFLRKNINPFVFADNNTPNGIYKVQVQYIIDKDGNIADIKPLTSYGYGMELEVIKNLKKFSRWGPVKEGKREKAYGKITVTFIKENDSYHVTTATPHTLYVGADNPVTISAKNVKPKRLKVTVSKNATIKRTGDFKYIIKVNTPGERVIFTLKKRGKNKVLSKHSIATTSAN